MTGNEAPSPAARRLPWIELASALVLGGVLAFSFGPAVGAFAWVVGIVFSLGQLRAEARLDARFRPVDKLAEIVDLDQHCDVEQFARLQRIYLGVTEPELQLLKQGVIDTAREDLERLSREKSSGELPAGAYYEWLLPMLEEAPPETKIRALSLMMPCEWDDSPSERRFIELNAAAAERGVEIERIFIMPKSELPSAFDNPAIRPHFKEESPGRLRGHFVDLDYLRRSDPLLLEQIGDGYIAFDSRVALIDKHSKNGRARGEVTLSVRAIDGLRKNHRRLLLHSTELSVSLLPDLAIGE